MTNNNPLDGVIDRSLNYGRHLIRRFLSELPARTPFIILDVGAGNGDDLRIARSVRPDASLHAVEVIPEKQILLGSQGIIVHGLDLERERLPFGNETVDCVIANQTLEHLKDIFWVLHEMSRVLRPGGSLIIGVPNLAAFHNRLLLLAGHQPTCIRSRTAHVRGYTRSDLVNLFEEVFPGGYRVIRSGGSNFYPFPPFIARPLAAFLPGMAWGTFILFSKQMPYSGEFVRYPVDQHLETNFYLG